jgi:hypothetical protein
MPKRIVPLFAALFALPAAANTLKYHGGRLLTAPRYINVFWGPYWNGRADVPALNKFMQVFSVSPEYNSALQEYAVPGYPIRPGSFDGGFVIQSTPGSTVYDPDVRSFLDNGIKSGALPSRTDDRVYVVMLPPSVTFEFGPGLGSPGGYHTVNQVSSTGGLVHYIVIPDATSDSTDVISHEMAETVTDPDALDLSRGWYDDSKSVEGPFVGEIGDLCENGAGAWVDGYYVSTLWSNVQNACVTSGLAASGSGGCPNGMVDENGICVPDNIPTGCSTSSGGIAPFFALLAFAIGTSFRRWSRSRRSNG